MLKWFLRALRLLAEFLAEYRTLKATTYIVAPSAGAALLFKMPSEVFLALFQVPLLIGLAVWWTRPKTMDIRRRAPLVSLRPSRDRAMRAIDVVHAQFEGLAPVIPPDVMLNAYWAGHGVLVVVSNYRDSERIEAVVELWQVRRLRELLSAEIEEADLTIKDFGCEGAHPKDLYVAITLRKRFIGSLESKSLCAALAGTITMLEQILRKSGRGSSVNLYAIQVGDDGAKLMKKFGFNRDTTWGEKVLVWKLELNQRKLKILKSTWKFSAADYDLLAE